MLKELFIENLAVIEKCHIEFEEGFNVFTGETGAGKSIIIGAINLILGGRVNKEIIRTGAKKASVIGYFTDLSDYTIEKLSSYGYFHEDEDLVIQREISIDGKSTARICGIPVTATILKEIAIDLINIHGQHDNQILLVQDKHIDIIDSFISNESLLNEYSLLYIEFKKLKEKLNYTLDQNKLNNDKIDILKYQLEEIEIANIKVGEVLELESEKKIISNYANIMKFLNDSYCSLKGTQDQQGAIDLLYYANDSLSNALEYFEEISDISQKLQSIYFEVSEISSDIVKYIDNCDYDCNRLDFIEERLNLLYKLKSKYGVNEQEIIDYYYKIKTQLDDIENSDFLIDELKNKIRKLEINIINIAYQINKSRKSGADIFINDVKNELLYLDMPNVDFHIDFKKVELNKKGYDNIEFLISTNVGEQPKPISKIASGGELSRIMLAIKTILANKDNINTLIFDEVDTGISGKAAQKTGIKLSQISKCKQVICITHLAQIAALADAHFFIEKKFVDNRTFTYVKKLSFDDRKYEIARIIGANNINETTLNVAQEMINNGSK